MPSMILSVRKSRRSVVVLLLFAVCFYFHFLKSPSEYAPKMVGMPSPSPVDKPSLSPVDKPSLSPVKRNAFALMCYAIQATGIPCRLPWEHDWSDIDQECLEKNFNRVATELGVNPVVFESWLMRKCEKSPQNWWEHISPGDLKRIINKHGCKDKTDEHNIIVWLAVFVRRDYGSMPYWLLWHLLLGIDHIVLYDNNNWDNDLDRLDSYRLNEAVDPFVLEELVTVVSYPGLKQQELAYNDALEKAKQFRVDFVGFLDADEFLFPFSDKCITPILKRCKHVEEDCGQVLLNWRMSEPTEVYLNPNKSIWENLKFGVGVPNLHVKTFVNVDSGFKFAVKGSDVHHATPQGLPYHSYRDDLSRAQESPFQQPEEYSNQVAIIFHTQYTSLLKYVSKKSIRGRATLVKEDFEKLCPICFGSLHDIIKSFTPFEKLSTDSTKAEKPNEHRIYEFMIEQDRLLRNILDDIMKDPLFLTNIIVS